MTVVEMSQYMVDLKNMNVVQLKQQIDYHVNLAIEIKARQNNTNYQQCF